MCVCVFVYVCVCVCVPYLEAGRTPEMALLEDDADEDDDPDEAGEDDNRGELKGKLQDCCCHDDAKVKHVPRVAKEDQRAAQRKEGARVSEGEQPLSSA